MLATAAMALVLYRVMRMRLKVAKRPESFAMLLAQLKRIHQQSAVTADGKTLTGLTEIAAAQKTSRSFLAIPSCNRPALLPLINSPIRFNAS